MNAINVISPYKHNGLWVFDDARVGLMQEPFVSGADTLIDRMAADIADAASGFILIFASTPFPGLAGGKGTEVLRRAKRATMRAAHAEPMHE